MLGLLLLFEVSKVLEEPAEYCHKTDKEGKKIYLCLFLISLSETS